MISSVGQFIESLQSKLRTWPENTTPWFRGESGKDEPLTPKVASLPHDREIYLLQSFRRKAGGLANTPPRNETDKWLFLAQHYGVYTRLLDWTEGALIALFFAINQGKPNPRVYMLDPRRLNQISLKDSKYSLDAVNFPLSWVKAGAEQVQIAWVRSSGRTGFYLPIALPATYQDLRMIAQRSCFTIHGNSLRGLDKLLQESTFEVSECLITYEFSENTCQEMTRELYYLGISAATIFPDLGSLARDLNYEVALLGNHTTLENPTPHPQKSFPEETSST